ncbi:MAG: TrmH family RNA methyltransferase, partial [Desulfovibrionaceae bacterium]|nr:TrmH family RNA methyltransferase [Desulfovibrionaceae bacterium]
LVFGRETAGLPQEVRDMSGLHVRIPMLQGHGRCLNLSTSCGIVLYAALAASGLLDGADWN